MKPINIDEDCQFIEDIIQKISEKESNNEQDN